MKAINEAFANGQLGRLEPQLQARLEQQVAWVARYAKITEPVAVNAGIARDRLNIVVTTPALEQITRCGRGNAIYDASLDTIFLDSYLLQPTDLPFIDNPGAISMSSLEEYGFLVSSLSFILAHEMGHRQSNHAAAAFFALNWSRFGRKATNQELAADRFAVRTLMMAHQAGNAPDFVNDSNALDFAGIHRAWILGAKERAAADIMGSFVGMSMMMQFASGPYSPFFRDSAHPSFLERSADAIRQVSSEASERILGQSPLLAEMIRRTGSIGQWQHHELHLPDPLARAEVRNGVIWIGTRAFYQVDHGQPRERLYRLDTSNIPRFILAKEGRSAEGELPGTWLDTIMNKGDSASSLAPATPPDIREERLFEPFQQWRSNGLAYAGQGWFWSEGGIEQSIAVEEMEHLAHKLLPGGEVKLGRPQRVGDRILVPTLVSPHAGSYRLRVLSLKAGRVEIAEPLLDPNFSPEDGWFDIEGVQRDGSAWLVPGRVHNENDFYRWRLWRISDGADPILAAEGRLLASFIGSEGEESFGRDLDPTEANLLPIGNDLLLVWFDNDSVWLVGSNRMEIAFHPAPSGLRITAIGKGAALFWIENAMKAYLVDFTKFAGETK